ncbi:MAG TPA: hypothetical protein EYQ57_05995, partial [Methylococcaceae bacterium]|nr:hypothetical protein [Methylococcaceae bacterium]
MTMLNNLLNHGYQAIPCNGKAPIQSGWSSEDHDLTKTPPTHWEKRNVGIRTGQGSIPIYAIDIDIYDPDVSEKILRSGLNILGLSPIRTGMQPKAMLFYRAEAGHKKIQRKWKDSTGEIHIVEILGHGQQFIAGGIHPETKQPYSWDRGTYHDMSASQLIEVKHDAIKPWLGSITVPDDWVEIFKNGDLSTPFPDLAELKNRVNATMISRVNTVQGGGFTIQQAAQALAE